MKTAAAYIRVSTDDQVEYSPDSQIKLIRDYAKRNDYILPDEFIFRDDGISGKSAKHRPEFTKMIALAKSPEHPFDAILVWKFSRFARNQEESIVFKNILRKIGVEVRSVSEPISEDPFGSLVERIIEWTDEYYIINLSGEVKRGMLEKISRGQPVVPPPVGYKMENGQYIPDENAHFIKEIFEAYAAGEGARHIAQRLAAQGCLTKRGNPIDNRFVDYVLHNPVYIGKLRWSVNSHAASSRHYDSTDIIVFDGTHEPLISSELWESVQKRLHEVKTLYQKYQRREQPVSFMLKGLVRCSSCGSTLCYCRTSEPSLQCHSYARGSCRQSHSINIATANEAVIKGLQLAVDKLDFAIAPAKPHYSADAPGTNKLLAAEYKKMERIKAAYANGTDTLEEYAANKKKISAEIARLEAELQQESNVKPINKKAFAKRVSEIIKYISDPHNSEAAKNQALRTVISYIIFDRAATTFNIVFHF